MSKTKDIVLMICGFTLALLSVLWFYAEHRHYDTALAVPALSHDEQEAYRMERSYTDGANDHKLIASGNGNAFYCKIYYGYEGPDSCGVFLERNGVYTYTGLDAAPYEMLLVAPDKKHIVVQQMTKDMLITVSDASIKTIYEAPASTTLGVWDANTDFFGRARWIDNSHLEVKVYSEDDNGNADENKDSGNGSEESKPIKTVTVSI